MLFYIVMILFLPIIVWLPIFIFLVIADIVAILHILTSKREEPTSALLWIFLVLGLSIFGLIAYVCLGINKIRTKALEIETANNSIVEQRTLHSSFCEYLKHISKYIYTKRTGSSYNDILDRITIDTYSVSGNKVELLEDGTSAYPRMLDAIEHAKNHVHLQSFIICDDAIGRKIFDTLQRKAEEGIRVRIIFDRLGSTHAYKSKFFKEYKGKSPNLEIKVFSKYNIFVPYRIQLRNHRKLLICDGKIAFIGGINISAENVINKQNDYIHDLHCEIKGPAIGELQFSFLRDWKLVTKMDSENLLSSGDFFPEPTEEGSCIVRVNPSGPGQAYLYSKKLMLTAANAAQKSLWIITPYFVPDLGLMQAICFTSARGVDVRVIIPHNNNHWYVRYASKNYYDKLISYGVKIYEKEGVFSHVKATLVDREWGIMGSSNYDMRSFRLNYELDFTVEGDEFISVFARQFDSELADSFIITKEMRDARSFYEEIMEAICALFTPIL